MGAICRLFFAVITLTFGSVPSWALSGIIVDGSDKPIPNARVFVETSLEGDVVEGATTATGHFTVSGEFFGNVGVIAFAPGYGFGGAHLNIAAEDVPAAIRVVLAPAVSLSGTVVDAQGVPLANARIASLAVTHPVKVGIPLSKMAGFGLTVPTTDAEGRFHVEHIPEGARLAVKVEHSLYAQEAITDVAAGDTSARIVMHRGVTVRGSVTIRGTDTPVAAARVTARNAQPPHDTAFGTTDGTGVFTLRLKPGVYLLQAHGAGRVSPGFQRLEVSGELPEQQIRLSLSDMGVIRGTIHDAISGAPIVGARILLETLERPAGATRTGASGQFQFNAAEGANVLHFAPVPGYAPPDTQALRVQVHAGETLELPGFWLAPAPPPPPFQLPEESQEHTEQ